MPPARDWRLRVEDILDPRDVIAAHPEIPWAEMRGMRNIVVHEYFCLTDETLWKTAREDLPSIIEPLRRLLANG